MAGGKRALGFASLGGKGALCFAFLNRCGTRLRLFSSDQQTVGGELSAAVVRHDGELARGHQLAEDLLDSAPTETSPLLERRLIGDPLAALVGVAGDREEDDEAGSALVGVFPDAGKVLAAHGWLPPFAGQAGAASASPANVQGDGASRK
jgi:hypothetical protein